MYFLRNREKEKKKKKEKVHTWRPAEAGSGKRLPVSGSQLPSTGQTPPEDMKRKRRKMWSICIFEMMYLNILSKSYLFLHIPGGIDLVNILHLVSSWLLYGDLGKFWHWRVLARGWTSDRWPGSVWGSLYMLLGCILIYCGIPHLPIYLM